MIDQNTYDQIITHAQTCPWTSMNYLDYEDLAKTDILIHSNELIVLVDSQKNPYEIYYATHSMEKLCNFITERELKGLIKFIPKEYINSFENLGFKVNCAFSDFVNPDITKHINPRIEEISYAFATPTQAELLADISQACRGQSRGFNGETAEWFTEWMAGDQVLVKTVDSKPVGFCCVSIYNEGTTLWVRELAVHPSHQGNGYAKELLETALRYGAQKGANKGFLAVDVENHNAIYLYKQYGFIQKEFELEIQMIK